MDDGPHQEIYFIGIALPPGLNDEISRLKWQLHDSDKAALKPPSLRGIMPSELLPRVRETAAAFLPFDITLTEVGHFGKRVSYLRADSHKLEMLQSNLVKLLPPDAQALHYKRPYSPHVTLLQVYDPSVIDADRAHQLITSAVDLPLRFTVDSVTYFRRILPREYRPQAI